MYLCLANRLFPLDFTRRDLPVEKVDFTYINTINNWFHRFIREFMCAFLPATLSILISHALSAISFITKLYHIPLDTVVLLFISFLLTIFYIADRRNSNPEAHKGNPYWFDELSLTVCVHFIFIIIGKIWFCSEITFIFSFVCNRSNIYC